MTFTSGQEMLEYLQSGRDLYSPEKELYVFLYNDAGSIAAYSVDRDEAMRLSGLSIAHEGENWSAFLGVGGQIYDDSSYERYDENRQSNLDYCNTVFAGKWFPPDNYEKVMTSEELNTKLYQRMFNEQVKFRDWLLTQPPEEILHHCCEYVEREDIVLSMENNDLSMEQCKALLKSPSPLYDVHRLFEKRESSHMEEIQDAIESRADDVIRMEKQKTERGSR